MANEVGSIASLGLGSGMDIQGLVDKLVMQQSEAKSKKIEKQEADVNAKITGYGLLRSTLAKFKDTLAILRSPGQFQTKATNVINDPTAPVGSTYFTATTNDTAINGSYQIEVLQYGKADKYASIAYNNGTHFSSGTLNIVLGEGQANSKTFAIAINPNTTSNQNSTTLAGIAQAINQQAGTGGISATLLNSNAGQQLIIASTNPGVANTLGLSVTNDNLDADPSLTNLISRMTHAVTPQDAQINIDNQLVTSSSNTIVNAVQGVTINILEQAPGKLNTLNISSVPQESVQHVKKFVAGYNELVERVHELTGVDKRDPAVKKAEKGMKGKDTENTKKKKDSTNSKAKKGNGELINDPLVRRIMTSLRNGLVQSVTTTAGNLSLASIGVKTDEKTGQLKIEENKLSNVISQNLEVVSQMFSDPSTGVATVLEDTVKDFLDGTILNGKLQPSALAKAQETQQGLLKKVTIDKLKNYERMAKLELRYLKEYARMDKAVGMMKSQGDGIVREISSSFVTPGLFNNK